MSVWPTTHYQPYTYKNILTACPEVENLERMSGFITPCALILGHVGRLNLCNVTKCWHWPVCQMFSAVWTLSYSTGSQHLLAHTHRLHSLKMSSCLVWTSTTGTEDKWQNMEKQKQSSLNYTGYMMGDIAVMSAWEAWHWIWAASLSTVELWTAVAVQMFSLSLILPKFIKHVIME